MEHMPATACLAWSGLKAALGAPMCSLRAGPSDRHHSVAVVSDRIENPGAGVRLIGCPGLPILCKSQETCL